MQADIDRVVIDRGQIARRVEAMARELAADLEHDLRATGHAPDESGQIVLVPILTGSLVFVADLIRHLPMKLSLELVAVSSYPGQATQSKGAKMRGELPQNLRGKHVVVIDDILDSGRTLALVKHLVQEQAPATIRTCVLLDKPARREAPLRADYVGFEIEDLFVVGYGLDFDGFYRNLPDIVALRSEVSGAGDANPATAGTADRC